MYFYVRENWKQVLEISSSPAECISLMSHLHCSEPPKFLFAVCALSVVNNNAAMHWIRWKMTKGMLMVLRFILNCEPIRTQKHRCITCNQVMYIFLKCASLK